MKRYGNCWVVYMVSLWKRYGKKLWSIILLQFELITFRFAYGRTLKPLIVMMLGFSDVSLSPQTNIIYLLRPQESSIDQENQIIFKIYIFYKFRLWKCSGLEFIGKDGRRTKHEDSSHIFLKFLNMDQYLPDNMKWTSGKSLKL